MRSSRCTAWVVAALVWLSAGALSALDPERQIDQYVLRVWDEHQGLPQSSVLDILQSKDGYLWLATLEGLVRFDGARFVHFDRTTNPELSSVRIWALAERPQGGLWVSTENGGLLRFDGRTFGQVAAPETSSRPLISARALLVDTAGDLWIGAPDGLWRLRRESGLELLAPELSIWTLEAGRDGAIWIGAADGLWRYLDDRVELIETPEPWTTLPVRAVEVEADGSLLVALWNGAGVVRFRFDSGDPRLPRVDPVVPHVAVVRMLRDRAGELWMSAEGEGLLRLTAAGVEAWGRGSGFPSDYALALCEDREGNLWVGADTVGLVQLRDGKFQQIGRRQGLEGEVISAGLEARDGALWIGSYGSGLQRARRVDRRWEVRRWTVDDGLPDPWIWALLEDRRGDLWVGTYQGLARVRGTTARAEPLDLGYGSWVRSLFEDREGRIWIATDYGVHVLEKGRLRSLARGIQAPHVTVVAQAPDGTIWLGSRRGLLRANGLSLARETRPLLDRVVVRALHIDGDGGVWIGSEGDGLIVIRGDRIDQLTPRHGLHDELISAIVQDGSDRLWLTSNRGVFVVGRNELLDVADGRRERVEGERFDVADGLPSREAASGSPQSAWRGRDGRLYIGTVRGLATIDPERIQRNGVPPPVHIEEILVDGELRRETPLVISPGRHTIQFDYTATSFVAPERVSFRYRLAGYDTNWSRAGVTRSAIYTNLAPGSYQFQVVAANDDGLWSPEGASVGFVQRPLLWQTTGFRIGVGIALLAAATAIPARRATVLQRRASDLERQVDERTRRLELERRKTAEQAERLARIDEEKSRFFANLTHELRTPLTLVLGPVEAALEGDHGELAPGLVERLEVVRRSARRQLRLVDQLLQLSRLDSGALVLHPATVRLDAMLRQLVAAFSSLADRRGIRIALELPAETPSLSADEEKLEQVFSNLISNALKFTPRGGMVTVGLAVRADEISIEVRDEGPGIPPEAVERLFDRFFRATERGVEFGVGIGLHLARDLVTLHSGSLSVASEMGRGSSFTVHLPRCEAPSPAVDPWRPGVWTETEVASVEDELALAAESAPASAVVPAGARERERALVLVVEDHPDLLRLLRDDLEREFDVVGAVDGVDALEQIEREMPELVVSDVMMPRRDGFELCRTIRDDPALDHLPIVLLTALADREDRLAGLQLGADAYLPKPVDRDELLTVARGLVERRRLLRERFRQEKEIQITDLAVTPLDRAFLERAVAAVESRIDDPAFGVEELAGAVAMSPRNLQRKLRAVAGASPHEFLLELRLVRARQLLATAAGNVSEVAFRVGFSDPSAFSRAFRRRYGHPPSAIAAS